MAVVNSWVYMATVTVMHDATLVGAGNACELMALESFAGNAPGRPLGVNASPSGRYGRSRLGERQCFQLYAVIITTQHTALFVPVTEYDALRSNAIND